MAKKDKAPETVEQPPVAAEAGLNLSDIRSCVSIIDIVTKRGAFEGAELADVGAVRNRLDTFLKAADAAAAAKVADEETETAVK
tara:strand:- start:285 stop:536 length:252 start_codon:yes stop_codon:yes gene_type:complete